MSLESQFSEQLSAGVAHHQAGRFEQARQVYLQLLEIDPRQTTVLSLLGAVGINLKLWADAERYLQKAVRLDPNHQAAHENLGVWFAQQGRMAEAVASFRRAAKLNPHALQTQLNLAYALSRVGQPREALIAYRRAAQLAPDSPQAIGQLSQALLAAGLVAEAVPHLRRVAELKANDPRAYFELAQVLAQAGQVDQAIAAYGETLRLNPASAEACVNLTQLYIDKREYQTAVDWAHRAIAMRPLFAEAHLNLGSALTKLEQLDEAKRALGEAARLKPELAQTYNNLGIVLAEQEEHEAAIEQYHRALQLAPQNADALYNIGIARLRLGDPSSAVEAFDRALALRPDYAEARHNRASALLLLGRLTEGWSDYEWRFRSRDFPPFKLRWPLWDGSDPAGKTLVLVAEQGLGDTLQFVRYARLLAERGAQVVVECPAALHAILAGTPGITRLISQQEPPPAADFCVPMLNLPQRFQTTLETIPAEVPYLFADEQRMATWSQRLAGQHGERQAFRVGIAWQGNAICPGDRTRSIPLAAFEPLTHLRGVQLYSLQKGAGTEQLAACASNWNIVDFGDDLDASGGAFMDTAAIIRQLDLVITSDTAIAHLAGGLGTPVWLALQRVPDWRWLLTGDTSPWYPTMRLFRQAHAGDWAEVFARIAAELRERTG